MPACLTEAATACIRAMLAERGPDKTLCPSAVARALAGATGGWRSGMDEVHSAADALLAEDAVALSWKGARRSQRDGPYRIGAPA